MAISLTTELVCIHAEAMLILKSPRQPRLEINGWTETISSDTVFVMVTWDTEHCPFLDSTLTPHRPPQLIAKVYNQRNYIAV